MTKNLHTEAGDDPSPHTPPPALAEDPSGRYRLLVEQASDGIAIYDMRGVIIEANTRAAEMLGYPRADLLGVNVTQVIDPQDLAATPIRFDELKTGKILMTRRLLVRKDGSRFRAEISARMLEDASGIQAIVRDITEREQVEESLRRERDFSESLISSSLDGIVAFDRDCRYTMWNPAMERMTGMKREDVLGKCMFDLFPFLREMGQDRYIHAALAGQSVVSTNKPYNIAQTGRTGYYEGHYSPLHNEAGEVVGGLAVISDITRRRRLEEQLVYQAFHDPLTRLPNRALFLDRLAQSLAHSSRRANSIGVIFLDLDDFKVINDSLGHAAGDRLLVEVGRRLQGCLREGDSVARLGGDEFIVLLEDLHHVDDTTRVAERINERLREPFNLEGHEMRVSASMGIAVSTSSDDKSDDLLRNADVAMYEAKARGKAHYKVFNEGMNRRAWARLQTEIDLRKAIERGELNVYYQPVVQLATDQIVEVEALARWQHPRRGLVPPSEFIPLAEETGLILPVGRWVLEQACRQVKVWQAEYPIEPPLVLSANLSVKQFKHPTLVEDILSILDDCDFDPASLKLEITESIAMEDAEPTIAMLQRLKETGIHLALDDFGTGYSSLGYLKRYSVDTLKIDHTFIHGLGQSIEDTAIVRAVLAFAKALGMTATAEGIETGEQLQHLLDLGCEHGQGFYFAHPMPAPALGNLLATPLSRSTMTGWLARRKGAA